MGGLIGRAFASVVVAFFFSFNLAAQPSSSQEERLHEILSLIDQALERIREGAEPCYEESCQRQKTRVLSQTQMMFDWLPSWESARLTSQAYLSAYRLVDQAFARPTRGDWIEWWKRRYQHEYQLRSTWPVLVQEVADLSSALKFHQNLAKQPEHQKNNFESYWNKGLVDASRLLRKAVKLTREASLAELEGKDDEAKRIRKQAQESFDALREWEAQTGERVAGIFRKIFPQQESADALKYVLHLADWQSFYDEDEIFHPDFVDFTASQQTYTKELYRRLQRFNDLEYGVIGFKQFAEGGPLDQLSDEIEIQNKIDRYEDLFRIGIDTGVFFYLVGASNSLAQGSRLLSFGLLAPTLYAQQSSGFDISEYILPRTSYSQELELYRFDLEQSMRRRLQSLKNTEKALLERRMKVTEALENLEEENYE